VLYKRKPVPFPEPPSLPEDLNVKCWYIAYTKEWFLTYDEYLKRLDYYNTRKFVCEITGNSCLTFFEAYESEKKEMEIVEKNFPEHLKEPILRHLQFSVVPRIDQLVDDVYTTFKNDYYPGETVMIRLNDYKNDFKTKCIIREKAKFNAVVDSNNNYCPAYCQYRVSRVDNGVEVVVDENQITRDRNNFTKWFVKTFIKLSVSRSPKIGAPWIVKSKYASKYRIPTELPPELAHFKEKPPAPSRKKTPQPIRPKGEGKNQDKKNVSIAPAGSKFRNILPATSKGGKPLVVKTASPPPPKRTVEEDLSQTIDSLTKRPKPHNLTQLEGCVQEALESWTFLNVYRVPLLLDTFTFDDFLTAMKWDSNSKHCALLDEIFCAVLSAFMNEQSQDLLITLPEDFDMSEFGESEEDNNDEKVDEVKQEMETNEDSNGKHKEGDIKMEDKVEEIKDEAEDEDDENDDEFEDAVEEQHNVEKYLEYRGISWQERLQKRNFKDGQWQIILVGVLDLIRDVKDYKETINEIFETLAPLDSQVSPNSIQTAFLTETSSELRVKCLNILCSLLVNSPAIRQFLDKCMADSTELRRERLEKLREYKIAFEKAQNIDKELREIAAGSSTAATPSTTTDNANAAASTSANGTIVDSQPTENSESKKRRRRTGLSKEPTEQELAIAKENQAYATLLASRSAQLRISEDLRIQRRNLEKKIVELDVQRIRYLGKDRLYNRYWWFENNGLPNLGGGKSSGGDEDNEGGDDEEEDDDDDEDDEFLNETYLMGRLWVQGPTDEDALLKLALSEDKVKAWNELLNVKKEESDDLKKEKEEEKVTTNEDEEVKDENQTQDEINSSDEKLPQEFIEGAEQVFEITFDQENKVIKSITENRVLVDSYGAAAENLKPVQRKLIEEQPDPLLTTRHWRFYDKASEIEDLIKWLNPWGERETKLLKELNTVKDQILSSVESRRKALKLDTQSQEEEALLKEIEEIVISDSEKESSSSESSADSDLELLSDSAEAEAELKALNEEEQPRTRRSMAAAEKAAEERRKKEAEIREKIAERRAKRERSRPGRRIAKREQKKRKIKEHEDKKKHKAKLVSRLKNLKEENEVQRCLDWVNQSALETLGHTHYEGPKRVQATRSKRSRR